VSTPLAFDAAGGTALSSLHERRLQLPRSKPAGRRAAQRQRRAGSRRSGARRIGYGGDDARIITDQLIDNSLCGYRFAGLPRILAFAREARTRHARVPIAVVHETPVSALVDGSNNVGYVAVYRGAEIAIAKAKQSGVAAVGVYNSYFSGRNAYYLERIVNAGLVGLHTPSGAPHIVPPGATRPALGTNPIAFGFPSADGPGHLRHRHGIADVGRGVACRRNRRGIAAGPGVRR
jgi:hypothetical protein